MSSSSKQTLHEKEIETSRTCKELKHYAISYGDSSEDPKNLKAFTLLPHPYLVWQAIL